MQGTTRSKAQATRLNGIYCKDDCDLSLGNSGWGGSDLGDGSDPVGGDGEGWGGDPGFDPPDPPCDPEIDPACANPNPGNGCGPNADPECTNYPSLDAYCQYKRDDCKQQVASIYNDTMKQIKQDYADCVTSICGPVCDHLDWVPGACPACMKACSGVRTFDELSAQAAALEGAGMCAVGYGLCIKSGGQWPLGPGVGGP